MMRRHALALVAAVALAIVVGATSAEKVVTLKNGRRLVGKVTRTSDGFEIRLRAGAVIVISADDVAGIEEVRKPQSEFGRRFAVTDKKDPKKLYELARWAEDNNLLPEARGLLKRILELQPEHENAKLLLRLVEIRLGPTTTTTAPVVEPTTRRKPVTTKPAELLRLEDVYRIRLHELQKGDKVRIEFRDRLLDRFIEWMGQTDIFQDRAGARSFRAASKVDQTRYILENTDRDSAFRKDILLKSDPPVMFRFKTRIWRIVGKHCGNANCHGGVKGKAALKLKLLSMPLTDDRVVYTNFYILQAWSRGGRKVIKRDNPEMSLLLQHGLPRNLARLPHPDPPRVSPIFRSPEDRTYKMILEWIRSLRYPLPGGYQIKYRIPGQPPKTTTTRSIFDE